MAFRRIRFAVLAAALAAAVAGIGGAEPLRVGSKRFTESYILGEILAQTAQRAGVRAEHRPGLGTTAILYEALKSGSIDVYPEYTGTIAREILKTEERLDLAALNARLAPLGFAVSVPLGFNNTYAMGMRREEAGRRGVKAISDLARHQDLRLGLARAGFSPAAGPAHPSGDVRRDQGRSQGGIGASQRSRRT